MDRHTKVLLRRISGRYIKLRESRLSDGVRPRKEPLVLHIKKNKYLYMMLLPVLVWYIIFCYLPMYGIVMSFQAYSFRKGVMSPFVGFENFRKIFSEMGLIIAIRNTFVLNFLKIIFGMPVPIAFALLLNEISHSRYKRTVQTVTYLPHFVSWIALAGIIKGLMSPEIGILNIFLDRLGLQQIPFLTSNAYFRWVLIFTEIWKGFGWGAIIYLAAIAGIDPNMYESAAIDGASRFQKAWHITLPSIANTFVIMLILTVGNITNGNVDQIFNLYSPLVYETSDIIGTFLLRRLTTRPVLGQLAAAGLARSVVCFSMLILANRLASALGYDGIYNISTRRKRK